MRSDCFCRTSCMFVSRLDRVLSLPCGFSHKSIGYISEILSPTLHRSWSCFSPLAVCLPVMNLICSHGFCLLHRYFLHLSLVNACFQHQVSGEHCHQQSPWQLKHKAYDLENVCSCTNFPAVIMHQRRCQLSLPSPVVSPFSCLLWWNLQVS